MAKATSGLRAWFIKEIEKRWYSEPGWLYLIFPLELLFRLLAYVHKHIQQKQAKPLPVPIIVVGNITVGGTGKTPTIISLLRFFQTKGFNPGVISRGYGRESQQALLAQPGVTAAQLGDEPFLIYQTCHCPVAVAARRLDAVALLLEQTQCDLILSDDGLQHYALPRDIELVVIDGTLGLGNGHYLPVGPLREGGGRLHEVDAVLINNTAASKGKSHPFMEDQTLQAKSYSISLVAKSLTQISTQQKLPLDTLKEIKNLVAIAGIATPQRFYRMLDTLGVDYMPKSFPDHHAFCAEDFSEFIDQPIVMTAKDAVKCQLIAKDNWYQLDVDMALDETLLDALLNKLSARSTSHQEQTS